MTQAALSPGSFPLAAIAAAVFLSMSGAAFAQSTGISDRVCAFVRGPKCDIESAIARGMRPTGLRAVFPHGTRCPHVDETWAKDYSSVRPKAARHGGIDMPAPFGEPIIAVADGEVIAVFDTPVATYRGREVWLRHSPAQTGLPYWIFTQYTHFDETPAVRAGQKVRMGDVLGVNGNSGHGPRPGVQSRRRRPAIHFAVIYSDQKGFRKIGRTIVPSGDAWWMDPHALYRGSAVVDTNSMIRLPRSQKRVPIPVVLRDGRLSPAGTRLVWPFRCDG